MIHILIIESFYTFDFASTIEQQFGNKVACFTFTCPKDTTIDLFILPGVKIIDGRISINKLKEQYGSNKSKVLAISDLYEVFMYTTNNLTLLDIDFAMYKDKLICDLYRPDDTSEGTFTYLLKTILHETS